VEAQLKAQEKTAGAGAKIDILFTIIRTGFFYTDYALMAEYIAKAKTYCFFVLRGRRLISNVQHTKTIG
jgi:hypothetical protein